MHHAPAVPARDISTATEPRSVNEGNESLRALRLCSAGNAGVGTRRPPVIGQSGQTQRFLQIRFFPPDFPPNSSLHGGKWRHGTVSSQSKKPYFRDKTALQDTGQYGWQRFRKPLLY